MRRFAFLGLLNLLAMIALLPSPLAAQSSFDDPDSYPSLPPMTDDEDFFPSFFDDDASVGRSVSSASSVSWYLPPAASSSSSWPAFFAPPPVASSLGMVSDAPLLVSKRVSVLEAQPGETIMFTIVVTNTTTQQMTDVSVEDLFDPSQLTVQEADQAEVQPGALYWGDGVLNPLETKTLVYSVRLSDRLTHGDVVYNTVNIRVGGAKPVSATAEVRIVLRLPATGAGDFTDPPEDGRRFLTRLSDPRPTSSLLLFLGGGVVVLGAGAFVLRRFRG